MDSLSIFSLYKKTSTVINQFVRIFIKHLRVPDNYWRFKLFKFAAVYNLSDCLSGFTDNNSIALRFDHSFLEDVKEIIIILKNLALNLRLFVPSLKRLFITFGIFLADVFKIH